MFFPPPLADDWTEWIVGEWEGAGTSDAGKGRGVARFDWEWRTGHKSTRITERVSANKMRVIERTPNPDGSVMEDKGEMTRIQKQPTPGQP